MRTYHMGILVPDASRVYHKACLECGDVFYALMVRIGGEHTVQDICKGCRKKPMPSPKLPAMARCDNGGMLIGEASDRQERNLNRFFDPMIPDRPSSLNEPIHEMTGYGGTE